MRSKLVERGPDLMAQAREEWVVARPLVAEAVKKSARENIARARARFTRAPASESTVSASV